ncbi:MAG: hypothetical protein Q4A66_04800 [Eubacteriales bacterium]|nr:hypothetical protein [Eubacteriales bacterium]
MRSNGLIEYALPSNRVIVIAGHYGSGKTEIALNMALRLRKECGDVTLVDLDIVNPFFRSAEQAALLEEHGVELLKPIYANTSVDIPSLPPQIQGVFARETGRVIFDVGGDDAGAAALGGFAPQFSVADKLFYMVVNPFRPRSESVEQIVQMYHAIARRARMTPDALICNANLGDTTRPADILEGYAVVREAAAQLGLPVACVCVGEGVDPAALVDMPPLFPIRRYLKPEWMEM